MNNFFHNPFFLLFIFVFSADIVSYSIPLEDTKLRGLNLRDSSYDGKRLNSSFVEGLGQLTDNIVADSNELLGSPDKEINWIGWTNRESVKLSFEFKELRKFENCRIHVAHLPDSDIQVNEFPMRNSIQINTSFFYFQVFSSAQAWFSDKEYKISSGIFEVSNDTILNTSFVSIPLEFKIGRYVKLELKLAAKSLLISEVIFDSGISIIK